MMNRKKLRGKTLIALLLVCMMLPLSSLNSFAAVGDLTNVSTGVDGEIDLNDTISLPIRLLDYEADGMLFEYAESKNAQSAKDFGATYAYDLTGVASLHSSSGNKKVTEDSLHTYWTGSPNLKIQTGAYANYARVTWNSNNTEFNWANGRAAILLTDFHTEINLNELQYVVLVYRTNVNSETLGLAIANPSSASITQGNQASFTMTQKGDAGDGSKEYWTYAVFDLKRGGITNWKTTTGIYAGLPLTKSGDYMDIAHIAYFKDATQAKKFGEYALTDGSDRGDNRAFGLLRGSREEKDGDSQSTNYPGIAGKIDSVIQINTYDPRVAVDISTIKDLGYTLLGTFAEKGIANVGLLESSLGEDGYPVYKEEVVTYLAGLLKHSLEIPERTTDGWKNYRYVRGTASAIYGGTDLATALRNRITAGNLGTYDESAGKKLLGRWEDVQNNITTYHDAAYFLLNNIFRAGSYNVEQDDYDYLVLSAGEDAKFGQKAYGFDGGFTDSKDTSVAKSAVKYDTTKKTIQNSTAAAKTHFYFEGTDSTTLYPFLPITSKNNSTGQTISTNYQDDGVLSTETTKDTLVNRNYNFAMVSEGEFVYHADDELFFDFEGDDDVYLFINNELVMDIGSAHSIDGVRIELNDYVNAAKAGSLGSDARNKALALEDGNAYTFKFYYMERHSFGSNIRVTTNIKVTDPDMITTKTAWQAGHQLDYGSVIEKDKIVEYGFAITNNGSQNLFNLTFQDNDIGVTLDETNGLEVTGTQVTDLNGEKLEPSDLTATVEHPEYDLITVTFESNEELKVFLKNLTANGTVNNQGLFTGATVTFRGIGYKLTEEQIDAGRFDNTVFTTATNGNGKTLHGQDNMRVYVPMSLIYYQWAGHDLVVKKDDLFDYIIKAAKKHEIPEDQYTGIKDGIKSFTLSTKNGSQISDTSVTIDAENNITFCYPTAGSNYIYIKITYTDTNKQPLIVPITVMVTDVQNSVYVLDYGLKADLTEKLIDTAKDAVTAPGRATTHFAEGITGTEPFYSNEKENGKLNSISFDAITGDTLYGKDGTFQWSAEKTLTYQPTDFMEEVDTIYAAIRVKEDDYGTNNPIGTVDINNEVEMYKEVTVLPATVVYYEDNFPAIHYSKTENTVTQDANVTNLIKQDQPTPMPEQGADQDENYGHDNVYTVASNQESSAGTLTTITVKKTGGVASFTFKGTGFELISRTTAEDSATIVVTVKDSVGTVVKKIPVITEFDNKVNNEGGTEKIYQVPIIRVNDLELGTYTVEITGVQSHDYSGETSKAKDSYLYVDGLRIYQPLGAENDNYSAEENGAVFKEIRKLIKAGEMAVVKFADDPNGKTDISSISSGTSTWVENRNGDEGIVGNVVSSVDAYLLYGPNNEVYLEGTYGTEALMLYVKETEGSAVHNLQVAMRGLDEGNFLGGSSTSVKAKVEYAVLEDGKISWEEVATLVSSTEQYYTIDYTKCPKVEGIGYQVVIRVTDPNVGENSQLVEGAEISKDSMASFTSLKLNGLDIVSKKEDETSIFGDKASFNFTEGLYIQESVEGENPTGTVNEITTENLTEQVKAVASDVAEYGSLLDSYQAENGTFTLTESARFFVIAESEPTDELLQTVQLANSQFAAENYPTNTPLPIVWGEESLAKAGDIVIKEDKNIGAEGYGIKVSDCIVVTYSDVDGLLYGMNSLMKFFIVDGDLTIPCFTAADAPDTKERTVMLDTGRKYYTKDWVCNFIKQMSWMGYNTIELHFSEDGGFRADFWDEKYYTDEYHPENDFSWLCGSQVQSWVQDPYKNDPDKDAYLTTKEMVEILQTAKEYHIDVIPSFDSPAHMDYITWKFEQNYKKNKNYSFIYDGETYKASSTNGCINYTNTTGGSTPTWPNYTSMDITKGTMSRAFVFALYSDIADFFKVYAGSTDFSIGGDEVNLTSYSTNRPRTWGYEEFPEYINSLNQMLNKKGYTCRMFNDFIGSTAYNQKEVNGQAKVKYKFDDNIEIMYWNSDFNPTTGNYDEKIWHAWFFWETNDGGNQDWGDGDRIMYNCIQTNCYYVLRVASTDNEYDGMDARNPENHNWTFYHSTEDDIYNEWYPNDLSEKGVCKENAAKVDEKHLGGAYFLIWNDYASLNTEKEVWEGVKDKQGANYTYSLFDRMYSNIIKMWNSDINSTVGYEAFATVRNKISNGSDAKADYFPGYQGCSTAAVLPEASKAGYAVDKTALLEALGEEKVSNDFNLYTAESYQAYESAWDAAKQVADATNPTADEIQNALETLQKAVLVYNKVTIYFKEKDIEAEISKIVADVKTEGTLSEEGAWSITVLLPNGHEYESIVGASYDTENGTVSGNLKNGLEVTIYCTSKLENLKQELTKLVHDNGIPAEDEAKYTKESWAKYLEVKQEAEQLLAANGTDATASSYEAMISQLKKAIDALELAGDENSKTEIISITSISESANAGKAFGWLVETTDDVTKDNIKILDPDNNVVENYDVSDGGTTGTGNKFWRVKFYLPTEAEAGTYDYTISVTGEKTVKEIAKVTVE